MRIFFATLLLLCQFHSYANGAEDVVPPKPKNIILLIGDGMGLSHITAAMISQKGLLNMLSLPVIGLINTQNSEGKITDSAAGATAFSTGKKTYNGAVAVGPNKEVLKTVLELAIEKEMQTCLISTSSITHATPASFIAHRESRNDNEGIALDFLNVPFTIAIGGGYKFFSDRSDKRPLLKEFEEKGYFVSKKLPDTNLELPALVLIAEDQPASLIDGRDINFLKNSVSKSLDAMSDAEKGFFMMVEGAQIDWGGHSNETDYVISELVDFDEALKIAIAFAEENGETLIIVTADHETGGLGINKADIQTGEMSISYTSKSHTATLIPVFAYGPGAEIFGGVYENTDIFDKMCSLLGLK